MQIHIITWMGIRLAKRLVNAVTMKNTTATYIHVMRMTSETLGANMIKYTAHTPIDPVLSPRTNRIHAQACEYV